MSYFNSYLTTYILSCTFFSQTPDTHLIEGTNLVIINTLIQNANIKDENDIIYSRESLDMQGVQIFDSSKGVMGTNTSFRSAHLNSVCMSNLYEGYLYIGYGIADVQQANFSNIKTQNNYVVGTYYNPPGTNFLYISIVDNINNKLFLPETKKLGTFYFISSVILNNTISVHMMHSNYGSVRCSDCYFFKNTNYKLIFYDGDKFYFENCYSDQEFIGDCIEKQPIIKSQSLPLLPKFVNYNIVSCKDVNGNKFNGKLILLSFIVGLIDVLNK